MKTRLRVNGGKRRGPAPAAVVRRRERERYAVVLPLQEFMRAYGHREAGREGREAFAARLGTSVPYLVQLGLGYRQASMEMAIEIEKATHGQVKVEHLLPAADWDYLKTRIPPTVTPPTAAPPPTPPRRKATRAHQAA